MSFHKVALRTSEIVFSNTTNSFQFEAPIPSLGAFTTPQWLRFLAMIFFSSKRLVVPGTPRTAGTIPSKFAA